MQRITLSVDDALAEEFEDHISRNGYESRSEAIRDLIRDALKAEKTKPEDPAYCVGIVSFIFNRTIRTLAERLSDIHHAHHDLIVSTSRVYLDHDHSLECVILHGLTKDVRSLANNLRTERGVGFGSVNIIGVSLDDHHHQHDAHEHKGHAHLHPKFS
jgi:CopG family nickel-responsive transcriptional regulator